MDNGFPKDFIWGAATAAYQIEGAIDKRGKNIWDTFTHQTGTIKNDDNGDIACDHYNLWRDDIEIMKQLNLNAYRFSIAWSRILPDGRGEVNQEGLDFYSQLVDGLLEANIEPYITLYHWDLPQVLQDDGGGWLRRGIIDDYVAYADIVTKSLGDRVKYWTTFNEPWVFSWSGYYYGEDAPGLKMSPKGALTVTHHAFVAHGKAVPVIRANVPDAQVGIVLDLNLAESATDKPEDIEAAKRFNGFQNDWYLKPIFEGKYPSDMIELYGDEMPPIEEGDMQLINTEIDYLGVNFYRRSVMQVGDEVPPVNFDRVSPEGEYTVMGWEVSPQGIYDIVKYVHDTYQPKQIYITENGAAFEDVVDSGQINDVQRMEYIMNHARQVGKLIDDGVPMRGYFVWSLMDNFEWAEGYTPRFGIVHVDYTTQKRTIKLSGRIYAEIASNYE